MTATKGRGGRRKERRAGPAVLSFLHFRKRGEEKEREGKSFDSDPSLDRRRKEKKRRKEERGGESSTGLARGTVSQPVLSPGKKEKRGKKGREGSRPARSPTPSLSQQRGGKKKGKKEGERAAPYPSFPLFAFFP